MEETAHGVLSQSVPRCRILLGIALAIWAGSASALSPPEYPVILVHGLNSTGDTWDEFLASVTQQGWTFGGQLKRRSDGIYYIYNVRFGGPPQAADIYTISFTSGNDLTYQQQGEELEGVINYILELTGKSKATCVGHSMGGLACRAYLSYARRPKVSQIITVGTPHLGSNRANIINGILFEVPTAFVTGARILEAGSIELAQLNTDTLNRYRNTPVAYTSIIVDNDDVVPERSQNFASVGLTIPHHIEVRIRLREECYLRRLAHLCETVDENVRAAVTSQIVSPPVAFVLTTETPRTRIGAPLRVKLSSSSGSRRGDLYLGALMPDGTLIFQGSTGEGNLGWTTAPIPVARQMPAAEIKAIDFDTLTVGSTGIYTYHALLVRTGERPLDGARISNLASIQFVIESGTDRIPRGRFIYASSHQVLRDRYAAPSVLWRTEVHPQGEDVIVDTIRTASGETPVITDLALTPTGELFGISATQLYRIDPHTAAATLVGPLGNDRMVALASDATGQLYAANSAAGTFATPQLFRVDRASGRTASVASFGAFSPPGASGDLAIAPTGTVYFVQEANFFCLWDCHDTLVTFDLNEALAAPRRQITLQSIGSLQRTGVFGLAFVEGELYGFTTDRDRTSGALIRIDPRIATVTVFRPLSFQASGAALRIER